MFTVDRLMVALTQNTNTTHQTIRVYADKGEQHEGWADTHSSKQLFIVLFHLADRRRGAASHLSADPLDAGG